MSEQGYSSFAELAAAMEWTEEEQREELLGSISDLYKSWWGFRPNFEYRDFTIDQLAEELERISEQFYAEEREATRQNRIMRRKLKAERRDQKRIEASYQQPTSGFTLGELLRDVL